MPRPTLTRSTLLAVVLMAIAVALAACTSPQTTFEPASDAADRIFSLYIFITIAAGIVGVLVLGAMAYILIKFRARPGRAAQQIHGNNALEIAWTIAPIVVLVIIAIPTMVWIATSSSREVADDAILVTATGHQWWFEFEYQGLGPDGGTLVTANEMHVPVGRQVAIELRSDDVIPLGTKIQALGFCLYFMTECTDKAASIIFPFCATYTQKTSEGLSRIWWYTLEFN